MLADYECFVQWVHCHCCVNDHGHRAVCMLKCVESFESWWCVKGVACQTDVQKPSTLGESSFMQSDSHMKSISCITGVTWHSKTTPRNAYYCKGCVTASLCCVCGFNGYFSHVGSPVMCMLEIQSHREIQSHNPRKRCLSSTCTRIRTFTCMKAA